jgi:hypothetical protein
MSGEDSRYHHRVPQFILRNFANNGKLYAFDKHNARSFQTNVKKIMRERDFNTVEFNGANE